MIRNAVKWAVIVGVSLAVTGVAAAQGRQRGQGGGFGGQRTSVPALLANEDVQTELKMTDEQKEKVKAFAPAQGQRGQRQPGQPRGNRGEANPEAAKAAETFVKETLTPD